MSMALHNITECRFDDITALRGAMMLHLLRFRFIFDAAAMLLSLARCRA